MISKIESFHDEYRFLSNFWDVTIEYEGVFYHSAEHAFQAAKTLDKEQRLEMARKKSPGEANRFGREITLRSDWQDVKVKVMKDVLAAKFRFGDRLAERLVETGDAELIEGNTWGDIIWGVCDGVGENLLGRLLMERRALLQSLYTTENKGVTHG